MSEKKPPKDVSRFLKGTLFDKEAVERLKRTYEASDIPELLSKLRILFGGSAAPKTTETPPKRPTSFNKIQEAKDGGRIKSFKRGGQFKGIF